MNIQKIIKDLKKTHPGKVIIQNKDKNGVVTEILCETDPPLEHPSWSSAVVVLDRSIPHYHNKTTETYKVLRGVLRLFVQDKEIVLNAGDTYTILPGQIHYAVGDETWFECKSEPGWTSEDYIFYPQEITIKSGEYPLKALFWDIKSKETLILVGGDGDDRFKFKLLANKLIESGINKNVITFSFRGIEEGTVLPIREQTSDLKEVIDWAVENATGSLSITCTSAGADSTVCILNSQEYARKISQVIFVDPADYYISKRNEPIGGGTWDGSDIYAPIAPTTSGLLKDIKSNTKIHVVNFLLRNCNKGSYVDTNKRHIDNPKCCARLNNDMVKSFYENTPITNRGRYIEDRQLPHAFTRDGNVEKNIARLVKILLMIE